jgi:hypothetical protein
LGPETGETLYLSPQLRQVTLSPIREVCAGGFRNQNNLLQRACQGARKFNGMCTFAPARTVTAMLSCVHKPVENEARLSRMDSLRRPLPLGQVRILLATLALLCCGATFAQISPGPLSRPHKSLDSATQCTTCHKLGSGEPVFRCLDCHTEIAARLAARRGYHPTVVAKPGSQDCARCHSEHNGAEFNLLHWNPNAFDHNQTGYRLEGKHAGVSCTKCHQSGHIPPAERAGIKTKDLNRTWLGVAQTCVTCHEDKHKGAFGTDCQQCHTVSGWKQVNLQQFDHSKTRYPLTGLHAPVKCEKCHTPAPDGLPRYTGLIFDRCAACHADVHKGAFSNPCQSCHTTSGWKKIVTTKVEELFDHSKTKYPLTGKHAQVGCSACHANGDFKKELPFAKCTDCHHPDPHSGQFAKRAEAGECSACHTVQGWKPSLFTVKEHATSAYPLQEKHATVPCEKCHLPAGKATLYKVKFANCTDCHTDQHEAQFAAAPYLNHCEQCHDLKGYKPSTFSLTRHKQTRFLLTGAHLAIPCGDCHKESAAFKPKPTAQYHWDGIVCTSCHQDPHQGQFKERMAKVGAGGQVLGCEACHSTKNWRDLTRFDHNGTTFPLAGAHRAVECAGCHRPPNLETRLLNVDFHAAPTRCEDCHQDVHGAQFANPQKITACADCHNVTRWKPSLFDHERRTSFSLKGGHQNVRCAECHKLFRPIEGRSVLFYKPTPKDCAECHGANVPRV